MKVLEKFLKDVSYQAKEDQIADQERIFSIRGRIHDAAIGSIRIVRKIPNAKVTTRPARQANASTQVHGLQVRKTMKLDQQNQQALIQTKQKKLKTARGTPIQDIIFADTDRKAVGEWATIQGRPWSNESTIAKVAWLKDESFSRDGASQALQCNEFFNEALVGHVISNSLANKVPHFIKQHAVWIDEGHGNLILDQGGLSFERASIDMTIDECISVFHQVLVTLLIGSKEHLKHHDMHLENIFVNRIKDDDTFQDKKLKSEPQWAQTVDGSTMQVQHKGILAKIGDYGLSSITDAESKTRVERVDYVDLDAAEVEWGSWNGNLQENPLYDLVTFLSKFFLEDELGFIPPNLAIYGQALYNQLQKDLGLRATCIGRPITQHFFVNPCTMSLLDVQKKQLPNLFAKPDSEVLQLYTN